MSDGAPRTAPRTGEQSPPPLTPEDVEYVLRLGIKAARAGNIGGARALFLTLTRDQPNMARGWLALAGVAATPEERMQALEQVLALEPDHALARQALERLAPQAAGPAPAPPPAPPAPSLAPPSFYVTAPPTAPPTPAAEAPRRSPRRIYLLAAGISLLILIGLGATLLLPGPATRATAPTPTLMGQRLPTPTVGMLGAGVAAPAPTNIETTGNPPPAAAVPPTAAPTAPPTATPLPIGTLLEYDGWQAVLLRPDYAMVLDGAIGERQPGGRFVLALLSVSNTAPTPRFIPMDLFILRDAAGRAYRPSPGASSAYLNTYGRGQRGNLALEDAIPPGGGIVSVPLIFDVPADAIGLRLTMGPDGAAGWQVMER